MEIRKIENEIKNEYPKMEQITNKRLKKSIPDRWGKLGLSSLLINILIKNNTFAVDFKDIYKMEIQGGGPIYRIINKPAYLDILEEPIIKIGAIISFIVFLVIKCVLKNKTKYSKSKKVKVLLNVLIIISIIVFILSVIASIIVEVNYTI